VCSSDLGGGRFAMMRCAVLTVSDRCSRGEAEDRSGPAVAEVCTQSLEGVIVEAACVADEPDEIERVLRAWVSVSPTIDLIVTTGGTGLSPRDHTPEAAGRVIERAFPALLELARARSLETSPRAYLSRGVAGVAGRSLIVTLPGSVRGATEILDALVDVLGHAISMLRGEDHARG